MPLTPEQIRAIHAQDPRTIRSQEKSIADRKALLEKSRQELESSLSKHYGPERWAEIKREAEHGFRRREYGSKPYGRGPSSPV